MWMYPWPSRAEIPSFSSQVKGAAHRSAPGRAFHRGGPACRRPEYRERRPRGGGVALYSSRHLWRLASWVPPMWPSACTSSAATRASASRPLVAQRTSCSSCRTPNPTPTVRAIMGAAFGCSGQRCMPDQSSWASARLDKVSPTAARRRADALKLHPTDTAPDSEMGPSLTALPATALFRHPERSRRGCPHRSGWSSVHSLPGFLCRTDHSRRGNSRNESRPHRAVRPVLSIARPTPSRRRSTGSTAATTATARHLHPQRRGSPRVFPQGPLRHDRRQRRRAGLHVGIFFFGWNRPFFGDLHVQGLEGIRFYTRQKVVFSRWDDAYVRTMGW